MKKTKKLKKPKSKQNLRRAKKRLARSLKIIHRKVKKDKFSINVLQNDDSDFMGIIKKPSGLRTYDLHNARFNGVHPEFFSLNSFEWQGLLTLKFHSCSYSKDNHKGHQKRLDFLNEFMNSLRIKLGISDREFIWVACEEFGFTGAGHLHVMFSFDYLKGKNRMDRVKISDFSENGQFFQEGRESVDFISRKLNLNPKSVDFHWRPMWENRNLVSYFCKVEFDREEKHFDFSDFWKKRGLLKAA
jgi:hypothetical protein